MRTVAIALLAATCFVLLGCADDKKPEPPKAGTATTATTAAPKASATAAPKPGGGW